MQMKLANERAEDAGHYFMVMQGLRLGRARPYYASYGRTHPVTDRNVVLFYSAYIDLNPKVRSKRRTITDIDEDILPNQ